MLIFGKNIFNLFCFQLNGEFGYDCHTGKCDIISNQDTKKGHIPFAIVGGIAYGLPSILIISSYGMIWLYIRRSQTFLKKYETE